MHDSEVVAAIAAGAPDGLAEAYDRYAAPLYTYCRSLLREPADAADAVQDTFASPEFASPELVGPELSSAEFGQPGTRDGFGVQERPASELSRCA